MLMETSLFLMNAKGLNSEKHKNSISKLLLLKVALDIEKALQVNIKK